MPVQIGAKTHNFTDPTGLLSDCYRRVEMFLGTLEAVAGGRTLEGMTRQSEERVAGALRSSSEKSRKVIV